MNKILLFGLLSVFSLAHATNITTAAKTSATLASTCAFTIGALSFGSYEPRNSSPQQASGSITALCSKGVSYSIGVDKYSSADPYFNPTSTSISYLNSTPALLNQANKLADGTVIAPNTDNATKALMFNLYTDSARTKVWTGYTNHWVNTNQFITGVGNGTQQSLTYYGSLAGGQFVQPGSYSASMVATIKF